jgi:hypothetical protein
VRRKEPFGFGAAESGGITAYQTRPLGRKASVQWRAMGVGIVGNIGIVGH